MQNRRHLFALSIALNCLLLAGGIYAVERKGGLRFVQAMADQSPTVTFSDLKRDIQAAHRGDVVLLGDSILDLMEPEYLPFPALNRGISGDTTFDVLARLPEVLAGKPKTIVLLAGINDLQRGASASEVREHLAEIVAKIPCRLVVLPLLPVNEAKYRRHIIPNYPAITMPDREDVEAINAYLATLPGFTPLPVLENGQIADQNTLDGLHLNARGLAILAEQVAFLR